MEPHETGFFTEGNSVEVVTGRNVRASNERLKRVMADGGNPVPDPDRPYVR